MDIEFEKQGVKPPLVSIIIPCYNYGSLIHQTLDSLLNQTLQNWEAIIIDDGSSDNTKSVVHQYEQLDLRFKYLYQENKGLSTARNTGIQFAQGKYIQFLDADDLISNSKLSVQVEFMELNEGCHISYTEAKYFLENDLFTVFKNINRSQVEWMPKVSGAIKELLPHFTTMNIMPVNSCLIRKSFLSKKDLFFDSSYKSLEDWEFWIRCLFSDAYFQYVEKVDCHAIIRIHDKSMTNEKERMGLYEIKLRNELKELIISRYFESNKKELLKLNRRHIRNAGRKFINPQGRINFKNFSLLIKKIGLYDSIISLLKELNSLRKLKIKII